jgi:hypothetical protein
LSSQKVIYANDGTVARVLHADDRDPWGDFTIETVEDVEPLLDDVKVLRENHKEHGGDMKHVARVPVHIVERAMREGWFHDQKAWARFLDDPDNAGFRVWRGRLI